MNLYFLKSTESGEVVYVGTARSIEEFMKVFNHYLYNLCTVGDYFMKARISDQGNAQFLVTIVEGYYDNPTKEYEGPQYNVTIRQYSPDRVYDLV